MHSDGVVLDGRGSSSRPALGPSQPPIKWAPWSISLGVNRPGSEADQSAPSRAEEMNGAAIPPVLHVSSWSGV
jgi:hypothetical protein